MHTCSYYIRAPVRASQYVMWQKVPSNQTHDVAAGMAECSGLTNSYAITLFDIDTGCKMVRQVPRQVRDDKGFAVVTQV